MSWTFRVILSHCFSISEKKYIYSPQRRRPEVDINRLAASQFGKYPPLPTSTSVNTC